MKRAEIYDALLLCAAVISLSVARADALPEDATLSATADDIGGHSWCTRESGVCEEFGYQAARRKACILLVSCRSVTNFAKMELFGGIQEKFGGGLWRSVMATTSSEGGMPGRMVRSQEPKEFQTSRGWATARY